MFNPATVVWRDQVWMLYRAEDYEGMGRWNGTSRIGLAVSRDGVHFDRFPEPVLYPTEPYEHPGGCEDPRVTLIDDTFYMTYTAFDGQNAYLCLATSRDLLHWTKHGMLFPSWKGDNPTIWSKSGAILPEKVNGKYIMYFGDTCIWLAESEDLIHWTPREEPVLRPRIHPEAFDSALIEPGPQPVLTDDGILLLYNAARRITDPADPAFGKLRYSAGQVLLDREDPTRVLQRTEEPFLTPGTVDECVGQVDHVVFVEGLVEFRGAWYLYYGMADSKIGVAIYDPAAEKALETPRVVHLDGDLDEDDMAVAAAGL
ncbi:MAG: glycoside hydrolase family 130 protein [Alicyclobacillus sp.]|nr:glycoside hydrolase family 130 protein [Alicyclobacillus sp.]